MPVRIIIFVVGFIIGFIGMSLILHFTGNMPDGIYIKQHGKWKRVTEEELEQMDKSSYSGIMCARFSCKTIDMGNEGGD